MRMIKAVLKLCWKKLTHVKQCKLLVLFAICLSVFLKPNRLKADHDATQITNLKATFIVNALNYIRWQAEDLPSSHSHVEMLVVGKDEHNIASRLSYIMSLTDFRLKNLSVRVKNVNSWKEARNLFGNGAKKIALLLDSELKSWEKEKYPDISGVLIMGESQKFLRKGLVLTFRKENNRLKLGVNLRKAKAMNLEISSKLLSLNRVVFQVN
tara:strand:- start:734 stop:1366 length:633 start_codon:yes stop_codon:yes gene_type:complete